MSLTNLPRNRSRQATEKSILLAVKNGSGTFPLLLTISISSMRYAPGHSRRSDSQHRPQNRARPAANPASIGPFLRFERWAHCILQAIAPNPGSLRTVEYPLDSAEAPERVRLFSTNWSWKNYSAYGALKVSVQVHRGGFS